MTTDIHLRLPAPLLDQLRARAEADLRSVNSMVIILLMEALAQEGQSGTPSGKLPS